MNLISKLVIGALLVVTSFNTVNCGLFGKKSKKTSEGCVGKIGSKQWFCLKNPNADYYYASKTLTKKRSSKLNECPKRCYSQPDVAEGMCSKRVGLLTKVYECSMIADKFWSADKPYTADEIPLTRGLTKDDVLDQAPNCKTSACQTAEQILEVANGGLSYFNGIG